MKNEILFLYSLELRACFGGDCESRLKKSNFGKDVTDAYTNAFGIPASTAIGLGSDCNHNAVK